MFFGYCKQKKIENLLITNAKDATELLRWAYQFRTKNEYMQRHRENQIFRYNKNRYFTDLQLRDPDYQLKLKSIEEMNKEFDNVVQTYEQSGKIVSFKHAVIERTLSIIEQTVNGFQTLTLDNSLDQGGNKILKSSIKKNQSQNIMPEPTQDMDTLNEKQKKKNSDTSSDEKVKDLGVTSFKVYDLQNQQAGEIIFQTRSVNLQNQAKDKQVQELHVSEVHESDEESFCNKKQVKIGQNIIKAKES